MAVSPPHRLILDSVALADNWRWLARASGRAACGAAIKADGYGLGAAEVARVLAAAGCRDVFVATWPEAAALAGMGLDVSVLHGVRNEDMAAALAIGARPVLNTAAEIARWRVAGGGPAAVMVDTGMNRLGIAPDAAAVLTDGLRVDLLMSHLACAESDAAMNRAQRDALAGLSAVVPGARRSLANSAGIMLGDAYHFDLTRPGLALYGGVPRAEMAAGLRQVAFPEAAVLQRRTLRAGDAIGYDATYTAARDTEVAILSIGYADGYWRGFSARGSAGGGAHPVLGRVSMDLLAVDVSSAPDLREGDWLRIDFALPAASAASGMSQYELLTGLGRRFDRRWS